LKTWIKSLQTLALITNFFLLAPGARGQEKDTDTASKAYLVALKQYKEAVKSQELLYNGSQYVPMEGIMEGHPYFHEEIIEGGQVVFDRILFKDITMRYDIVYDKLIVHHVDQEGISELVQLQSEMVTSFNVAGYHFEYIARNDFENLDAGFYIPLYRGNCILLKKVIKEPRQETENLKVITHFNEKVRYYVVHEGVAYRLRGKRSLLKILNEEKLALKSYIQKAGLEFRDEEDYVKLLKHYDEIR